MPKHHTQQADFAKASPESIPGEARYVDFEDEFEMWGAFGEESGHCYRLFHSEECADEYVKGDTSHE